MSIYIGGTKIGNSGVSLGGTLAKEVYLGSTKVWPDIPPWTATEVVYSTAGAATYTVPVGPNKIDVICLGGGGGGDNGGAGFRQGAGGLGGGWGAVTLDVKAGDKVELFVGAGGSGGGASGLNPPGPTDGGTSKYGLNTAGAIVNLGVGGTAKGGQAPSGSQAINGYGPNPKIYTYNGRSYTGGASNTGQNAPAANPPGGGGGGGQGVLTGFSAGAAGATGRIWLWVYQV